MINIILILSIAVNVLLTAIVLLFCYKINKVEKRYEGFISKFDEKENIEEALKTYLEMVKNVNEENKIIKANIKTVERQVDTCVQNIGMVRYNAFDDVGSELSFAILILFMVDLLVMYMQRQSRMELQNILYLMKKLRL